MKNKLRSAASKPIPKIEQSLGYKLGQMYKKPGSLAGGLTWHGTLLRVRGEIHKALPFPQWERKYLKSQAENKLIWPCDHPSEHKTNMNAMSFRILRGQRNTRCFLERPAKVTHCPLPPKKDNS